MLQNKHQQARMNIINMTIASIGACSNSLLAQLSEYDFLTVTDEQAKGLEDIYNKFLELTKEITRSL